MPRPEPSPGRRPGYLIGVMRDAARSYRYRGGIRRLLGLPEHDAKVRFAPPPPPVGFHYVSPAPDARSPNAGATHRTPSTSAPAPPSAPTSMGAPPRFPKSPRFDTEPEVGNLQPNPLPKDDATGASRKVSGNAREELSRSMDTTGNTPPTRTDMPRPTASAAGSRPISAELESAAPAPPVVHRLTVPGTSKPGRSARRLAFEGGALEPTAPDSAASTRVAPADLNATGTEPTGPPGKSSKADAPRAGASRADAPRVSSPSMLPDQAVSLPAVPPSTPRPVEKPPALPPEPNGASLVGSDASRPPSPSAAPEAQTARAVVPAANGALRSTSQTPTKAMPSQPPAAITTPQPPRSSAPPRPPAPPVSRPIAAANVPTAFWERSYLARSWQRNLR